MKEFLKIALSQAFGASTSATMSPFPSILEAATEGMRSLSGKNQGRVQDVVGDEACFLPGTQLDYGQG